MSFIEEVKKRAKENLKTIILPESEDTRVLEAACKVTKQGFARIILLGNEEKIKKADIKQDFLLHLLLKFLMKESA